MTKNKILPSDIQDPILRKICEEHGTDWLLTLADAKGGETAYVPKRETLEENSRDRFIRKSKDSGPDLARRFKITVRRVQQIREKVVCHD